MSSIQDQQLTIIHVNDTEGEPREVWPRLATAITNARGQDQCDLLVHAGDLPLETDTAPDVVRAMAQLGFDAVALGNHDLAASNEVLREHLTALQAPMLCANVQGLPVTLVQPYRRLMVKGWRVVIIGVTLGDLPRFVTQRRMRGLTVQPPEQVLADLVPRLRPQADLLIVLSHSGHGCDHELPRVVPGIDLVIGGHDHLALPNPERVGAGWVTQAGSDGAYAGRLTVTRRGGQVAVTGDLLSMEGVTADADLRDLLAPVEGDEVETEVAGYTTTAFRVPGVDVRSPTYWRETPLGNLTVDLMRAYATTDLAFLRCAIVRNELPAGPIYRADLQRLNWNSDDQVVRLSATGKEIRAVLESGARGAYRLLVTAGARVIYDATRDVGMRVVSVEVQAGTLDPDQIYTIACSEVLANGVGDYPVLATKPRELLPLTIGELLAEHIRVTGTISPTLDGRLVIHGRL